MILEPQVSEDAGRIQHPSTFLQVNYRSCPNSILCTADRVIIGYRRAEGAVTTNLMSRHPGKILTFVLKGSIAKDLG